MSVFQPETYTEAETRYTFLWHANGDACDKCIRLDGERFENQDIFQNTLFSPIWGDILNIDSGELLTHPNCRCNCEVQAEVIIKEVNELDEYQSFLRLLNK